MSGNEVKKRREERRVVGSGGKNCGRDVEKMRGRNGWKGLWFRRVGKTVGETCKMRCLEKACDKKIVQTYIGRDE